MRLLLLNLLMQIILRSTNYAISRAAYTQFYGIIYALGGISGNGSQLTSLNALNITCLECQQDRIQEMKD